MLLFGKGSAPQTKWALGNSLFRNFGLLNILSHYLYTALKYANAMSRNENIFRNSETITILFLFLYGWYDLIFGEEFFSTHLASFISGISSLHNIIEK